MLDGRCGGHRRGSPRYSYNAGSAGLVNGTGYPTRSWVCFLVLGAFAGGNTIWRFTTAGQCSQYLSVGFLLTWIECPFFQRRAITSFGLAWAEFS